MLGKVSSNGLVRDVQDAIHLHDPVKKHGTADASVSSRPAGHADTHTHTHARTRTHSLQLSDVVHAQWLSSYLVSETSSGHIRLALAPLRQPFSLLDPAARQDTALG